MPPVRLVAKPGSVAMASILEALESEERYLISFVDALVVQAEKASRAAILYRRALGRPDLSWRAHGELAQGRAIRQRPLSLMDTLTRRRALVRPAIARSVTPLFIQGAATKVAGACYRVFRNAISAAFSSAASFSPNSWPLMARV